MEKEKQLKNQNCLVTRNGSAEPTHKRAHRNVGVLVEGRAQTIILSIDNFNIKLFFLYEQKKGIKTVLPFFFSKSHEFDGFS